MVTPDQFQVTEAHRLYCEQRWGHPRLADIICPHFVQNWKDRLEDGRRPKWKSADRAFLRWLRTTGPGGEYFNAQKWEEHLHEAKRREGQQRQRIHRYDPRGRSEPPTERSTAQFAASAIQRMRGTLGS